MPINGRYGFYEWTVSKYYVATDECICLIYSELCEWHGDWNMINSKEYHQLAKHQMNENYAQELPQNCIS